MSFAGIDINTILYFAAIIVAVVVVFGVLSFVFKHLIHWFARGCGCLVLVVVAYFLVHVVLRLF